MKKILIIDLLILIIIGSILNIAYATNSSFLDAAQNALNEYKPNQEIENNALQEYMNQLNNEMIYSNAILNATENALNNYEEQLKKEEELLNQYDKVINESVAKAEAERLIKTLKKYLDVYKKSVQIDNKLYLEYYGVEVGMDIYSNMTSNAIKIFEKNTNWFKKADAHYEDTEYYYYDAGRLRTLPVIYNTDTYTSELELTSATEDKATFDVIIKNIKTGKTFKKYTDGLKIVKEGIDWKIDSLKFKDKVEKDDTYPEYVVVEKTEEKVEDKKENNPKEETKQEETTKNEVNEVVSTNKEENVNVENNASNTLNQNTNTTITENENNDLLKRQNIIYIVSAILCVVLIFTIYKIEKYNKTRKEE